MARISFLPHSSACHDGMHHQQALKVGTLSGIVGFYGRPHALPACSAVTGGTVCGLQLGAIVVAN
jgi:hypothetical protein